MPWRTPIADPCGSATPPWMASRAAWSPALSGPAAGLDADHAHVVLEERVEEPDRVRAAADAGDEEVRQRARRREHLLARLLADHRLEVADHRRERVRAEGGAEQVVRRAHVRHPVAHRLVDRVLERARAGGDAPHLGAEEAHARDVRGLALHVLGAHVDDAVEAEEGADGGSGDAVLARARLGDDALLAHPLHEQRLAERVVDLVGAGVAQVLALEEDAAAEALGQAARRGRAASAARRSRAAGRGTRTRRPGRAAPPRTPPRSRAAAPSASRARSGRRTGRSARPRPATRRSSDASTLVMPPPPPPRAPPSRTPSPSPGPCDPVAPRRRSTRRRRAAARPASPRRRSRARARRRASGTTRGSARPFTSDQSNGTPVPPGSCVSPGSRVSTRMPAATTRSAAPPPRRSPCRRARPSAPAAAGRRGPPAGSSPCS